MAEASQDQITRPAQPPASKIPPSVESYRVKRRVTRDIVDFPVIRKRDGFIEEAFFDRGEAEKFCQALNGQPFASVSPQQTNIQSAVQGMGQAGGKNIAEVTMDEAIAEAQQMSGKEDVKVEDVRDFQ